jgi:hypothetical protein
LYWVHPAWVGFELATLVVIGTDYIGSCKSNYHNIMTMMAPLLILVTWPVQLGHNNSQIRLKLVLLWAQLTKIYPSLPTSVQPISITKTLLIVPTKYERDPPLFTSKLLIKFQNILRNTTQVIIQHRVKIIFSVKSSPITLEWQKWKSSKKKGILLSSPVNSWYNFKRF